MWPVAVRPQPRGIAERVLSPVSTRAMKASSGEPLCEAHSAQDFMARGSKKRDDPGCLALSNLASALLIVDGEDCSQAASVATYEEGESKQGMQQSGYEFEAVQDFTGHDPAKFAEVCSQIEQELKLLSQQTKQEETESGLNEKTFSHWKTREKKLKQKKAWTKQVLTKQTKSLLL